MHLFFHSRVGSLGANLSGNPKTRNWQSLEKKTTSGKQPKFSFAQEENIAPFTVPAEACHAVS